jgi:hypothetical protein
MPLRAAGCLLIESLSTTTSSSVLQLGLQTRSAAMLAAHCAIGGRAYA